MMDLTLTEQPNPASAEIDTPVSGSVRPSVLTRRAPFVGAVMARAVAAGIVELLEVGWAFEGLTAREHGL